MGRKKPFVSADHVPSWHESKRRGTNPNHVKPCHTVSQPSLLATSRISRTRDKLEESSETRPVQSVSSKSAVLSPPVRLALSGDLAGSAYLGGIFTKSSGAAAAVGAAVPLPIPFM